MGCCITHTAKIGLAALGDGTVNPAASLWLQGLQALEQDAKVLPSKEKLISWMR